MRFSLHQFLFGYACLSCNDMANTGLLDPGMQCLC